MTDEKTTTAKEAKDEKVTKPQEAKVTKDEKPKDKVSTDKPLTPTGELATDPNTRTFIARNIKGRGGKGPCTLGTRGNVTMPNGDIAQCLMLDTKGGVYQTADTFDPVAERMTVPRLRHLMAVKFVNKDEKVLAALAKATAVEDDAGDNPGT